MTSLLLLVVLSSLTITTATSHFVGVPTNACHLPCIQCYCRESLTRSIRGIILISLNGESSIDRLVKETLYGWYMGLLGSLLASVVVNYQISRNDYI